VENITHSLIGATLAEIALPKSATPRQRRLFFVTGVLAANLPDADLLYTRITPAPLGYLLQHRGYTHTIGGLTILAALIGLITLLPSLRPLVRQSEPRYGVLVLASLASHLVADAWNSYGVHPFWPLSSQWYYGDSVYIAEPWLWMLFGVSAAMNTRNDRARVVIAGSLIAMPIIAAFLGLVAMTALIPIGAVAVGLNYALRNQTPHARAWVSLALVTAFVTFSFQLHRALRRVVVASTRQPDLRDVVDVVLDPQPGNQLCWRALLLEASDDSLYMRRGTIAIGTHDLPFNPCGRSGVIRWDAPSVQSVSALRDAMHRDCAVRAWLQFGRAPVLGNGWIADARFGGTGRGNFTAMQVAPGVSANNCPAHLTDWSLPRADILAHAPTPPPFPR
jgi:inner membrane protein